MYRLIGRFTLLVSMFLGIGACHSLFDRDDHPGQDYVDYNFDVKPILSDRCFSCHGPDAAKRKGDLRLDEPESAYARLVNHPDRRAIVPGKPRQSEVIQRILSDDPDLQMPPPESKLTLTSSELDILTRWIEQGAEYEPHWSFQPPRAGSVPEDQHPIDYFVDRKLEKVGLKANALADPEHLIRRLYFDLNGLPPTLEEVDRFLQDPSDEAYGILIDTLLSRTAYGERMAADWMDLARYADSDGYLDDKHRQFSPWRDWVISAFDRNMPYDQFVTWQLAGDLLEDANQESILATAFNRLHRKNSEAGIVFEEYRTEYVADRVHTFSKAFLGLTMECARCHDHKYDPITQKEYYQLFAYFNSTNELGTAVYGPGQTPGPSLLLMPETEREIIRFIDRKIEIQQQELEKIRKEKKSISPADYSVGAIRKSHQEKLISHTNFDKRINNLLHDLINPSVVGRMVQPHLEKGISGEAFYVDDYNYVILGDKIGWYDRTDPFSVSLWIRPGEVYEQAGIFTHCEDLRLGYKGYSLHLQNNHLRFLMAFSWPTNAIEILSEVAIPEEEWSHIAVTYDGSSRAEGIALYINGRRIPSKIILDNLYKGILFEPDIHTYGFAGFRLGYRDKVKPFKGGAFDEIKIFNKQLTDLEVQFDYDPSHFSITEQMALEQHFMINDDPSYQQHRDSLYRLLTELNERINPVPEIMVMGDLPVARPTHLLQRGRYDMPGEEVFAAIPEALSSVPGDYPANRLGLAQWLFSGRNPLTARVLVNRIWQQHFGTGLVKTSEDFGAQGSLPSHPELLDWLAVWFQANGWDIKKLHRLMVTSRAYRRSSLVDSLNFRIDPENTWIWRGPSQRLSAEMIRDNALAISGLLVKHTGGPSVYPYQPAGLWDELSNKVWRYPYLQESGDGLYRRSLYTIWKRTSPPPSMLLFDVPDRSFCTVQRRQTNTPLQALVLLNDPQYSEAARVLAMRCLRENGTLNDALTDVFRLTIGRVPATGEWQLLKSFYEQELERINLGEIDVEDYLSNGEMEIDGTIDRQQLSALALTTHNLMNTYEAQQKK